MRLRVCERCPTIGAKTVDCVCTPKPQLCAACADSHACPSLQNVDPKAWKKANAPESDLTGQLLERLNREPGLHMTRVDSGGARQRNGKHAEPGTGDLVGLAAPDGIHVEVETKNSHKASCTRGRGGACPSCAAQKRRAAKVRGAGGVYAEDVRSVDQGVERVRAGLLMARMRRRDEDSRAQRAGGITREEAPAFCQETKGTAA